MSRKKGSKNKIKGIAPFKITHEANKLKETSDGFITDEMKPIKGYRATLKVLGHVYESQGNTIDEVLNNFKPEGWIKGAGVLIVEKDGIIREKIIAGNHIRNLFGMASGTLRSVSLKWVRSLFV